MQLTEIEQKIRKCGRCGCEVVVFKGTRYPFNNLCKSCFFKTKRGAPRKRRKKKQIPKYASNRINPKLSGGFKRIGLGPKNKERAAIVDMLLEKYK